jgi:rSAM/selenodomain-associated transferase 2
MTLSIIIPTYNEANYIGSLINHLNQHCDASAVSIIVADGGSTDHTIAIAKEAGATALVSPHKGRSAQMNYGASLATSEVLYFVHADTFPPSSLAKDIKQAIAEGFDLGRYRTKFDSTKAILKLNAWATRFDLFICMGGDQTLFIKRDLFQQQNGFREDMKIMEDYEFCARMRKGARYKIMKGAATVSARKYDTNSWWAVQRANAKIMSLYKKGASQPQMLDTYKQLLDYRENSF